MKRSINIALAQHNSMVGDLQGNAETILQWINQARDELALILFFFLS